MIDSHAYNTKLTLGKCYVLLFYKKSLTNQRGFIN